MDTASLKVKFTPLMKKVHLDQSTCCLEIVPEVSALKNFDKIKWKKDKNFYEYLIPITYKIILKRREHQDKDIKDSIDNPNSMYHSCVDLLHPSVTSYSLASGDVNKTISDNFILGKVTSPSDLDMCNIIFSQHKKKCCAKNVKTKVMSSVVQTVAAWDKDNATISDTLLDGQQNQNNAASKIDAQVDSSNNVMDNVKVLEEKDTNINQEAFSPLCISHSSDDTIKNRILAERTQIESLRKLSVTPICSINTYSSPLSSLPHENSFFTNSFFSRDYDSIKEFTVFGHLSPIPQQTFSVYTTAVNVDNFKPQRIGLFRKLTPEERIEQIIKYMEKEIMPLKYMLNDIIARYSALVDTPHFFYDTATNKLHTDNTEEIKRIEGPEEQLRSNRVVFNVVFDG